MIALNKPQINLINFPSRVNNSVSNPISFSGKINNDTFEKRSKATAFDKSIKICTEALKCDHPHEKCVLFDEEKNELLLQKTGDANSCAVSLKVVNKFGKCLSKTDLMHGHPSVLSRDGREYTPPLSIQDFRFFNGSKLHKIIATDKNGKISSFEKTPDFKPLTKRELKELEKEIFAELFISLPDNFANYLAETRAAGMLSDDEIFTIVEQSQLEKEGMAALDKFWKNKAQSLGLQYKSEMEY